MGCKQLTYRNFNFLEVIHRKNATDLEKNRLNGDHLGNIRLSYADDNGDGSIATNEIREENNYYPFGLKHKGYNSNQNGRNHKYGFGGKEEQDEIGLAWIDITARNYDPAIGRWMNLDPLAEKYLDVSPFAYVINNPLVFIDPDGMQIRIYYNETHTKKNGKEVERRRSVTLKNLSQESLDNALSKSGNNQFVSDVITSINATNEESISLGYEKGVFGELAESKKVTVGIQEGTNDPSEDFGHSSYNESTRTITFSNELGFKQHDQDDNFIGKASPSFILLEEAVHAARDIIDNVEAYELSRKGGKELLNNSSSIINEEEKENEIMIRATLHLKGEVANPCYYNCNKVHFRAKSVTSTEEKKDN